VANKISQTVAKLVSDITEDRRDDTTRGLREAVPSWTGSTSLEALDDLVQVAALMPHEVSRRVGLSTTELHALRHLTTGPMGPVELAKLLGVTSAASSGVVDRLVARGHAERRPHRDDGRRTEVMLTESGRAEVFAVLAPMFERLATMDAALDDDTRSAIEAYLRGAVAAMRAAM
jgi:DNA-binding MarR family transcriptional regulator